MATDTKLLVMITWHYVSICSLILLPHTDTVIFASAKGHLDTVKYLVEDHHCDLKCKLNNS